MKTLCDKMFEWKKYRVFKDEDLVPWTGGDELVKFPPLAEKHEDVLIVPKRESMRPKNVLDRNERTRIHSRTGRQTGTKSPLKGSIFCGSHGWRGRK